MGVVFSEYMLMVWYAGLREEARAAAEKKGKKSGLTEEELDEGKVGAGGGEEFAVCLEEMVEGQVARVMPGCHHAFQRPCCRRMAPSPPCLPPL
ncbi:putative E3 ubiquitin-protein ligase ATL23 [Cocos nucifera]|uniref:Putative E3 ubiquitin-protein ligase ATL23 n=1 Tax=Cocos nucifera TaxID=13894 RepID=A0A8K0I977_COCNU|nr:putative E3 ubiquitin-protein ligase ATL23 [Cocos nucifera]